MVGRDAQFLAVRDAAFEAAGVVGRARERNRRVGCRARQDFVVHARAGDVGDARTETDADRFGWPEST